MFKKHRLVIGGIVVAVLLLLILIWKFLFASPADPELVLATVRRGTLEKTVEATGTLEPKELVGVGAQVSGRLEELYVTYGDTVRKGDPIALIDAQTENNSLKTAQANLANMQAQLASTDATLAQKKLAFARQKMMGAGEATSQADFEAARADLQAAQASRDSLAAQTRSAIVAVNTAQVQLGYTKITAPMDGVVVSVVTKQGQTVNAVQSAPTIVVLAKLDQMTVKAQVSEADVINVRVNQSAYFTILGDPDKKYEGKLRLIKPAPASIVDEVNTATNTGTTTNNTSTTAIYYDALFDVPNADGRLRALMTAKVTILQARHTRALIIPSSALGARAADGSYSVRVKDKDGVIAQRKITAGLDNNVNVEVLSGLKEGEQVVAGEAKAGTTTTSKPMMGTPGA
jgi:macrolide-specific efflux system membrane fusion protein